MKKNERPPSAIWIEAVMAVRTSILTHADKSVAWAIANRAYGMKGDSFPSYETIGADIGTGSHNVKRHLDKLESLGWLSISKKQNSIKRDYNIYKLTMGRTQTEYSTTHIEESTTQTEENHTQDEGGINKEYIRESVMEETNKASKMPVKDQEIQGDYNLDDPWTTTSLDSVAAGTADITDTYTVMNGAKK